MLSAQIVKLLLPFPMATFLRRDDYARDSIDLLICGRISEWDPLRNLCFKES